MEVQCIVCGKTEAQAEDWGSHENVVMDRAIFSCSDECADIVESHRTDDGFLDIVGDHPVVHKRN
jgi:predicted nucleic acid-binding Zn ribbon protein